jgi:hypothetical protein
VGGPAGRTVLSLANLWAAPFAIRPLGPPAYGRGHSSGPLSFGRTSQRGHVGSVRSYGRAARTRSGVSAAVRALDRSSSVSLWFRQSWLVRFPSKTHREDPRAPPRELLTSRPRARAHGQGCQATSQKTANDQSLYQGETDCLGIAPTANCLQISKSRNRPTPSRQPGFMCRNTCVLVTKQHGKGLRSQGQSSCLLRCSRRCLRPVP